MALKQYFNWSALQWHKKCLTINSTRVRDK
jgi:hypothetical protein